MSKLSAFQCKTWGILFAGLFLHTTCFAQIFENVDDDFEQIDAQLEQSFVQTDAELEAMFEAVHQAIEAAYQGQSKNIQVKWPNDVVVPSGTTWVVYSEDYEQRIIYDFEQGFYRLEVPKTADTLKNINTLHDLYNKLKADKAKTIEQMDVFKKAIQQQINKQPALLATVELTSEAELPTSIEIDASSEVPNENKNYELIETVTEIPSDIELDTLKREIEALSLETPDAQDTEVTLLDETTAKMEAPITIQAQTENQEVSVETSTPKIEKNTVDSRKLVSEVAKDTQLAITETTISLQFPFVNNYQKTLVEQQMDTIIDVSKRFSVETSLVMAIIEAESSFNPMATSHIPAFGLMQLVPKTAGIDAYKFVYGEGRIVTPDYLYNVENNLKLGTAYLSLLQTRYLRGIEKPSNLLYSTIASYNTGVGNLARSVSGQKGIRKAIPAINQISDEEYFDYLQENLPALETKRYLQKVIKNKQKYEYLDR